MISENTRFEAGEGIKKGDVVKYVERVGIVKASSGFVDDPIHGRVLTPEPAGGDAIAIFPPSPYNAKPVPRFEVEMFPASYVSNPFTVPALRVALMDCGSTFGEQWVRASRPRRWFEKGDPLENDIRAAQTKLWREYALCKRLSGSAETLTGVRLV